MGAAAEFVKDHPFLTFFIATAAIEGVVTIVRGCRCPKPFERSRKPGSSSLEITTRFPWVAVSRGRPQAFACMENDRTSSAPTQWPHHDAWREQMDEYGMFLRGDMTPGVPIYSGDGFSCPPGRTVDARGRCVRSPGPMADLEERQLGMTLGWC